MPAMTTHLIEAPDAIVPTDLFAAFTGTMAQFVELVDFAKAQAEKVNVDQSYAAAKPRLRYTRGGVTYWIEAPEKLPDEAEQPKTPTVEDRLRAAVAS